MEHRLPRTGSGWRFSMPGVKLYRKQISSWPNRTLSDQRWPRSQRDIMGRGVWPI